MKIIDKHKIWVSFLLLILCFSKGVYSQNSNGLEVYTSCEKAKTVCGATTISASFRSDLACENTNKPPQYFAYTITQLGLIQLNTGSLGTYSLYGPLTSLGVDGCEQIALGVAPVISGTLNGSSVNLNCPSVGYYILKVDVTSCVDSTVIISTSSRASCCDTKERPCFPIDSCEDCISSFSPTPGKYVFSAWCKGNVQNVNEGYSNPKVKISFSGISQTYNFSPSGSVIDGWQRIDGELVVPNNASDITITFECGSGDCYFDDVRFIPFDGKMISYVYDPISLKMVAELDERNYATLYEYDEEGKLIRVKKETERGVMTIKENRENIHK